MSKKDNRLLISGTLLLVGIPAIMVGLYDFKFAMFGFLVLCYSLLGLLLKDKK